MWVRATMSGCEFVRESLRGEHVCECECACARVRVCACARVRMRVKQVMTRLAVFSIQSISSYTTFKYGRFFNMTRGSLLPLWHGQILEDSEAYVVFLRSNVNTNSGFFSFEKHNISMERNDIRKEANNTKSVDYLLDVRTASLTKWVDGCKIWLARSGSSITSGCAVHWA